MVLDGRLLLDVSCQLIGLWSWMPSGAGMGIAECCCCCSTVLVMAGTPGRESHRTCRHTPLLLLLLLGCPADDWHAGARFMLLLLLCCPAARGSLDTLNMEFNKLNKEIATLRKVRAVPCKRLQQGVAVLMLRAQWLCLMQLCNWLMRCASGA